MLLSTTDMSARHALRAATREVHERLHRQRGFAALLDGTILARDYRDLLVQLHGFHRPLEEALFSVPRQWWLGLDMERRRAFRLDRDLVALGMTPDEIAAIPQMPRPEIGCSAALLGALYVREGATLGGRVLARQLAQLGETIKEASSFFAGTPRDGRLWSEFCATLERIRDRQHVAIMTEVACATFAAFEAWFDGRECWD